MKSLGQVNHPDLKNPNCRIIGWRVEIEEGDDAHDVLSGALLKLPETPFSGLNAAAPELLEVLEELAPLAWANMPGGHGEVLDRAFSVIHKAGGKDKRDE